jgi:hypothetical protein
MKWIDIYEKGIKSGLKNDLRSDVDNKIFYGLEKNPYPDSVIITGENEKTIKNLFVSIDIDISIILLVVQLINNGVKIDGILSHHPTGKGLYNITEVIRLQKENWQKAGIRETDAQRLYEKIYREEELGLKGNYNGPENAADFFKIPLMCIHTPVDNIIQVFFEKFFKDKNDMTIDEALSEVSKIPECKMASEKGDEPFLVGNLGSKAIGKYFVDMTGGVDPPDEIFKLLKKTGIDTIIGMHYNSDNISSIMKSRLSAIICGHMACDSIGMNIFCDLLEKEGVNIISGPGFYRYKRNEQD